MMAYSFIPIQYNTIFYAGLDLVTRYYPLTGHACSCIISTPAVAIVCVINVPLYDPDYLRK